jgi:hypothetical protein
MTEPETAPKSCGPQPLPTGSPCAEWTTDELLDYSNAQNQAILDEERTLAVAYWRLGRALNLLREDCQYGQWAQLLERLGIDKTRASKARAIARTFDDERQLAGLTIEEAYQRRRRNEPLDMTNGQAATLKLCRLLVQVATAANGFLESMEDAELETINEVQTLLDRGIADLERVRTQLNR